MDPGVYKQVFVWYYGDMTTRTGTCEDGHRPAWAELNGITVIGCECGWKPKKPSARTSMQHVSHNAHRKSLKIQPVEYVWSEADYYVVGALSTGAYQSVRGAWWDAESGRFVPNGYAKI
jgi:hypothetical protein